uniref:Spatacsin C-terminal domain-containing protein n=1 Tax=Echeneis naucrates TaxID=173247 RepID=A0A665VWI5_ECHNA
SLYQCINNESLSSGVCELQSLRVLSFAAGRCCVLLNADWLLQLLWLQGEELQVSSCCNLQPTDNNKHTTVHHCVCRGTLFSLSSAGLVSVYSITDGSLLATVNLPAYLSSVPEEDNDVFCPSSSSFCLLGVSADLSTAVAVTQAHGAVGVDLNHYFRSWKARLASMYSRAQQAPSSSGSPPPPTRSSWSGFLPHLESQAPSSAQSRAPGGGATITFSVSETSAPSLLVVSEFSALLTFVSPGNRQTTVALWDLESGMLFLCCSCPAPCLPPHPETGMVQVLFSVSQQDLLSRLMLFGSAATVDAVCHLNNWGLCSIPIHALKAGLKNRQLDTVDFYLKSKENILSLPTAVFHLPNNPELCPALDLLCSAVRESNSEAQSRQFSEQLLNITINFVNTQILLLSVFADEDKGVRRCVDVLDRYVIELRSYMKKYPWPEGGDTSSTDSAAPAQEEASKNEWEELQVEEVICQSILTNQIPRAQAILRRRGHPKWRLSALRMEGLQQVFSCLQRRDLQTANTLLTNMAGVTFCLLLSSKNPKSQVGTPRHLTPPSPKGKRSPPAHFFPLFRVIQMSQRQTESGVELLEQLVGQRRPDVDGGLWRNLRLDWVSNWDQNSQTAILLSRLQHTELSSCDSAVLWRYLTALHDQRRVVGWIQNQEAAEASLWPELTPEMVNDNTLCSSYLRENILDLLARKGLFVPDELADLEQLLWRLAQGGGVMASAPPVPQYHSPLGLDLHSLFITFCLDRGLQYLLYTYLEHYRLTPRNCPLLTDASLMESQPWFEMLVKIQEITRDLSDPGLVFQASLTSAQVLLPGSQASLSSLLLEGHSLLALAAIMFAPGGIDQVAVRGERCSRSERTVDPQLLKMALASHSKLKAALFPTGPRGHSASSDISVYHLLQSLHPLDPSRLFGWQEANTLNSTETSELPHFSSPSLVNHFALVENLDFLYYLRHGRPSFAFATFVVQQLSSSSDVGQLVQQAWLQVYRLAVQYFNTPSVASAAVCFCELLGVCSLKLRVDVRAMNTILQHKTQHNTHTVWLLISLLYVFKAVKLVEVEPGAAEELIINLEAAVTDSLEQKGISRSSYEAGQEWALPLQFCQLHGLELSSVYPTHCASDGQFIHFLLFVQLHNFPLQQVRSLLSEFGPALQAHLSLAFQDLQVSDQRRRWSSEDSPSPATEGSQPPKDLFLVLLQSQEEASPCRYLLQEALLQRCPTLAVLAACHQGAEPLACLCVWVLTSIDDVTVEEATSHLIEAPQHHEWNLHDLSIIWRTLLGRGHVRPLLQGFKLFQKDSPLVLVLRMFELCCDYRNFSEAKAKLLDFQRTLITVSPPGTLQRSVRPGPDVALGFTDTISLCVSVGPDFRKLSQLSQLLQGSEVILSPRLLQCSSPAVQQEEFQAAVDALQARGRYSQARQVALLAGLPVHRLLLSQLLQEVNSQKSKTQWRRLETRVSFWKKCHDELKADETDPESASQLFLSHSDAGMADSSRRGSEVQTELLDVQERCLLLSLTAHWLSLLSPPPVDELQNLEKRLWISRVRQHVLTIAMEKESVFNLPPAVVTPELSTYETLMKEFSFSTISALNSEMCLSLDGLPGPSEDQEDPDSGSRLSPEERTVLASLIGQLLDDGGIHEAGRICRYFSLYHPDVWLVLRCRGLASGELDPKTQEEPSEAPPTKGLSTASFSSLAFLMLPLLEDDVAIQLQKLVDQCRHGNGYCKQVLSLYQLSKELQTSFSQICSQEPRCVLEMMLLSDQPERFRKAQVFIKAQGLSADSVAQLVSSAVVQALLAPVQDLQAGEDKRQVFRPSEGRDSLIQLIKLCDDPNLVGVKLLENLNTVPLRDLNCIVELLIVAHDCFSLTCNMEGIVRVLQAARHLSHAYLAPGEHYGLLVRLLTGIGRYNEMTYVFDLLHQNHRFEMLLRKKTDTDRRQSSSLKTALLDYIKRCLPADSEKHNMVALCFSMRREIGENHEMAAKTQLKIIESQVTLFTWMSSRSSAP